MNRNSIKFLPVQAQPAIYEEDYYFTLVCDRPAPKEVFILIKNEQDNYRLVSLMTGKSWKEKAMSQASINQEINRNFKLVKIGSRFVITINKR